MSIEITVVTGKPEEKKSPAGLIRRTEEEKHEATHPQVSISELVSDIFTQIATGIHVETDVEVEITGTVEFANKDGKTTLTYDVSGVNQNARTMKLKFNSKIQPK